MHLKTDNGRETLFQKPYPRNLDELVLPETTRLSASQVIEEQQGASLLWSHSLEPRHRVLLVG
jgi:hypothetical protein